MRKYENKKQVIKRIKKSINEAHAHLLDIIDFDEEDLANVSVFELVNK